MRMQTILILATATAFSTGCSVVGIRTVEEHPYEVLVRDGNVEVRAYEPALIAETVVEDETEDDRESVAFRRLAGYIFGDNTADTEISMTAPVVQETDADAEDTSESISMTAPVVVDDRNGAYRMSFVMPAQYDLASLPRPTDPEVTIRELPGRTVATIRYSGRFTEANAEAPRAQLLRWIDENDYVAGSEPRTAGFDPPWTIPFLRRNEIHVDVAAPPGD